MIKGVVHPQKKKILSLFTHAHVDLNLHDIISHVKYKRIHFEDFFAYTMKV